MAEEHGFRATEGHRLCANNCGFFGSLTTSNLCSKCHRHLRMKEEQGALAKAAFDNNGNANNAAKSSPAYPSSTPSPPPSTSSCLIVPEVKLPESASAAVEKADLLPSAASVSAVAKPNRCLACRKRVGLTGFKCRCGSMFCGPHRYPEQHSCTFDYKAAGKEAIAKANPVVKADKLNKI